jgi:hypothetical protein
LFFRRKAEKMRRLIITFLLVTFAYNSFSQSKASASASATIVSSSVGIAAFADTGSARLNIDNELGANSAKGNPVGAVKIDNSTNRALSFSLIGANEAFDITLSPGYTIAPTFGKENISLHSFTITPVDKTTSTGISRTATDETSSANREANFVSTPLHVVVNFN